VFFLKFMLWLSILSISCTVSKNRDLKNLEQSKARDKTQREEVNKYDDNEKTSKNNFCIVSDTMCLESTSTADITIGFQKSICDNLHGTFGEGSCPKEFNQGCMNHDNIIWSKYQYCDEDREKIKRRDDVDDRKLELYHCEKEYMCLEKMITTSMPASEQIYCDQEGLSKGPCGPQWIDGCYSNDSYNVEVQFSHYPGPFKKRKREGNGPCNKYRKCNRSPNLTTSSPLSTPFNPTSRRRTGADQDLS